MDWVELGGEEWKGNGREFMGHGIKGFVFVVF